MRVLACDPGFAAFGYVVVDRELGVPEDCVRSMAVIRTKKSAKKRQILAVEDNFARCQQIAAELRGVIDHWRVRAIAFEAFSVPQKSSKSNLVKIGFPYGILAGVAGQRPVVMLTPQQVRKAVCGPADGATPKTTVAAVVKTRFENDAVVCDFSQRCAKSIQNHAWDALAVYLASWQSDVMKAMSL